MYNKFNLNNYEKLKIIYFRDGLKGVLNVIFFFLGFKFRLISDDQKKISFFSKYISSKSNKISILEKLNQITKILDELNANEVTDANESNVVKLPKYISIKNHITDNTKFYLVYDKKCSSRNTLQVLCYKSIPFSQNLNNFLETIKNKFNS